jgi:hypothetical protein
MSRSNLFLNNVDVPFIEYTPVLTDAGYVNSPTYTVQAGFYQKIGSMVFVSIIIGFINTGSLSGPLTISLPEPSLGIPSNVNLNVIATSMTFSGYVTTDADSNVNYLILRDVVSGLAPQTLTDAAFAAGGTIEITGAYFLE